MVRSQALEPRPAKYEDGVFKPLEDVSINLGTIVEVRVPSYADRLKAKSRSVLHRPLTFLDPLLGCPPLVVEAHDCPENWSLTTGEDRRTAGQTCALLLATLGGRTSEPAAVRGDAGSDCSAPGTDGIERKDGGQVGSEVCSMAS